MSNNAEQYTVKTPEAWTMTRSESLHNSYDPQTFKGVGPVMGHVVDISGPKLFRISVWGHFEDKDKTEAVANEVLRSLNEIKP